MTKITIPTKVAEPPAPKEYLYKAFLSGDQVVYDRDLQHLDAMYGSSMHKVEKYLIKCIAVYHMSIHQPEMDIQDE